MQQMKDSTTDTLSCFHGYHAEISRLAKNSMYGGHARLLVKICQLAQLHAIYMHVHVSLDVDYMYD